MASTLSAFVKQRRKLLGITQVALSKKAGVGLRLLRDLEQGKKTIRLDKANQVLRLFGYAMGPVELPRGGREENSGG
jgi:y4mF family transcriptional regulator